MAVIRVDAGDLSVANHEVWAIAEDCVNAFSSVLSVISWAPVSVRLKRIDTESSYGAANMKRAIILPEQPTVLEAPIEVSIEIFKKRIDKKLLRAIIWLRKALAEEDPFDRFLALMLVSSLIAPMFPGAENRWTRACGKCGHREEIGPGDGEYFNNFYQQVMGESGSDIWRARGSLVHGGLEASATEYLRFLSLAARLETAILNALVRLVGQDALTMRQGPRFDLRHALLDVMYCDEKPPGKTPQ